MEGFAKARATHRQERNLGSFIMAILNASVPEVRKALEQSVGRYASITMCAFGGMDPAIIIERIAPERCIDRKQ